MASVRRKATSSGQRRYEVRWRDAGGRDRCRTFSQLRDAQRFKVEAERRRQLGGLYDAEPEGFGEFLGRWLGWYEHQVRPSTYERSRQALRQVVSLAAFRLDELRAAEVEAEVLQLARRAPRQAAIALRLVKQVLRDAQERGHLVDRAIFALKAPRYEEREPRFLTWAEVEHLASLCGEGPLVVVAALTGLRQGELFALRADQVDLSERFLRVESGSYAGALARTKSGRKRVVRLTEVAASALADQFERRADNELDLVFPSPTGRVWRKDNFMARVFRPAVRRAGLDGLTFHDLRHTYASLTVAAGVTPMVIAEQLGHRDARLVLERYGHLYPGASGQAAIALDLYLEAATVGQTWGGGGVPDEPHAPNPVSDSWSVPGSNRRPPACKAGALPAELTPRTRKV